jgi:ribosomal protein S21
MAQNFASNIASAPMDDSLMASFIFKSIEIGTLKPENVMATLERHGITLSIKRDYFYMDSSRNQKRKRQTKRKRKRKRTAKTNRVKRRERELLQKKIPKGVRIKEKKCERKIKVLRILRVHLKMKKY